MSSPLPSRHSHTHTHQGLHRDSGGPGQADSAPAWRRRDVWVVAAVIVPALIATVIGMVALWPHRDLMPARMDALGSASVELTARIAAPPDPTTNTVSATVSKIADDSAQAITDVAGSAPTAGDTITVSVTSQDVDSGMAVGSSIRVLYLLYAIDSGGVTSPYVFLDYDRTLPILLLAIVYGLAVVAVARWRGLAAFLGLGLSIAVIAGFTLPALMTGRDPLGVALVSAVAIMVVSVYVAHGVSVRTSTALAGTILGLAVTAALGNWAARASSLTGMTSDEAYYLPTAAPFVDLRGVVVCGIVLAGLGVLNDVSITQASAVWELRAAAPTLSRRRLFRGALRIGSDHIASTVYTIVFAYMGASLPLFMMVMVSDRGLGVTLTSGQLAEELVRTLVSSIGLVLAIPLTTALGAALAPGPSSEGAHLALSGAPARAGESRQARTARETQLDAPQTSGATTLTRDIDVRTLDTLRRNVDGALDNLGGQEGWRPSRGPGSLPSGSSGSADGPVEPSV